MTSVDPNKYGDTTRSVDTNIGVLGYVGGFPTEATVQKAYDQR